MEKQKINAKVICHLALLGLLFAVNVASAIIVLTGNTPGGFAVNGEAGKTTLILYGIAHVVNALALACGFLYLIRGGGKNVAAWYKAFIVQIALGVTLRMVGSILFPGFGASACFMIGIVVCLLVLAFVSNLGKQKTWIIFTVLLTTEVCLAIVIFEPAEALSSIAGSLTRLILEGTLGVLIFQKYDDKAARKAAEKELPSEKTE